MDKDTKDFLLIGIPVIGIFVYIYYSRKQLAAMQSTDTPQASVSSNYPLPNSISSLPAISTPDTFPGNSGSSVPGNTINISTGGTSIYEPITIGTPQQTPAQFPLFGYAVEPSAGAIALGISQATLQEQTSYLNMQNSEIQTNNQQVAALGASQLQTVTNSGK